MRHFYCKYGENKVIKVDWSYVDADMDRYEINKKDTTEILAIQFALENHFNHLKKQGRSLPCFPSADDEICILKVLKNEFAYLYFYDVLDAYFSKEDNCWYSILTLRRIKQGASGKCCS